MYISRVTAYLLFNLIFIGVFVLPRIYYKYTYPKTKGIIVGKDYSIRRVTFPVVEFNVDGRDIQFLAPNFMPHNVGQSVEVLYNPSNPKHAYVTSFYGFWGNVLLYTIPVFIISSLIALAKDIIPARIKIW